MPTVRVPIDIAWTGASGSPGVNVWHARVDSIADPNPDIDAMADVLNTFYEAIRPLFYVDVHFSFAGEASGVGDDTGTVFTGDSWTLSGSGNQGFAPPADCLLAQWKTGSGGRNGRGRTFLGPLDLACLEANGTPVEAKRTLLQGAIDDLVDASDSFGNGALGVYSRTTDTFRDFTSGTNPNYFAVLRSRRD